VTKEIYQLNAVLSGFFKVFAAIDIEKQRVNGPAIMVRAAVKTDGRKNIGVFETRPPGFYLICGICPNKYFSIHAPVFSKAGQLDVGKIILFVLFFH
jgi:hypothetical protein